MELNEYLTIGSIVATGVVGYILRNQITAQKTIIDKYKGLVEATSPDKIIALHEREVTKIKALMDEDIKALRTQILEMGSYIDHEFNRLGEMAVSIQKPELFDRKAIMELSIEICLIVLPY